MALSAPQRIKMIRDSANRLCEMDWEDLDLILNQFGLPTTDQWNGSQRAYVVEMIGRSDDPELQALWTYLVTDTTTTVPIPPAPTGPVQVFFSHLASHKKDVQAVAEALGRYGVVGFVAHSSIEPSKEWALVIEETLTSCDAMAVFLHDGFAESKWCDQEVGWVLGRSRPLLPLNFGIHPYGFMGKYQDRPCSGLRAYEVADHIMTWLLNVPDLDQRLAPGLIEAFVTSRSWDFTRRVAPLMAHLNHVSSEDLDRIEKAADSNVDIRECAVTRELSGPAWVAQFVERRRLQPAASA